MAYSRSERAQYDVFLIIFNTLAVCSRSAFGPDYAVTDRPHHIVVCSACAGLNLTPFTNHILEGNATSPVAVPGSADFFSCVDTSHLTQGGGNGWGCHVVITLGFVVTAAMAIPCGRWNLGACRC